MKRLISTALALTLLSGASALAVPQDDRRGGDRERGGGQPRAEAPARAAPAAPPPAAAERPQAAPQRAPAWQHPAQLSPPPQPKPQAAPAAPAQPPARAQAAPAQRGPGWERGGRNGQAQAAPAQRGPGWENGGRSGPPNAGNNQGRPGAGNNQGRGPGWENGGRAGPRPPVVRPEDRRNRDNNRPRYDPRRWAFQNRASRHYAWRGPRYVVPYGFYSQTWAYGQILPWSWYTSNYYIDNWAVYGLEPPAAGCEWVREGNDALMVNVFTGAVYSVVYNLFY